MDTINNHNWKFTYYEPARSSLAEFQLYALPRYKEIKRQIYSRNYYWFKTLDNRLVIGNPTAMIISWQEGPTKCKIKEQALMRLE